MYYSQDGVDLSTYHGPIYVRGFNSCYAIEKHNAWLLEDDTNNGVTFVRVFDGKDMSHNIFALEEVWVDENLVGVF